jgi:hypothetical protein
MAGNGWLNAIVRYFFVEVKKGTRLYADPVLISFIMVTHQMLFVKTLKVYYSDLCASISISINCPSIARPFTSSQVPVGNCFL